MKSAEHFLTCGTSHAGNHANICHLNPEEILTVKNMDTMA
jgi:hypothetical protein